jgi:hypothetical protein
MHETSKNNMVNTRNKNFLQVELIIRFSSVPETLYVGTQMSRLSFMRIDLATIEV